MPSTLTLVPSTPRPPRPRQDSRRLFFVMEMCGQELFELLREKVVLAACAWCLCLVPVAPPLTLTQPRV